MEMQVQAKKDTKSQFQVIARSGNLEIAILEKVETDVIDELVEVSESLADKFGPSARLNSTTIRKYFNYPDTYPFIALLYGEIIGYIIGVPLEYFRDDIWSQFDDNLGKKNTVYTYAFAFKKQYHKTGYAKTLKRIFYSRMRKNRIKYISGHVVEGTTDKFSGAAEIIKTFKNWHGTGLVFEYYRRPLRPESY